MARMLVALIAFAALGYLGYATMTRGKAAEDRAAHAPKRQLDNVREKAREIERKDQQNLDELEKKLEP